MHSLKTCFYVGKDTVLGKKYSYTVLFVNLKFGF